MPYDGIDKAVMMEDSFKGNPILVFGACDNHPFSFGVRKARLLLKAIQAIGGDAFAAELVTFIDANNKSGGNR